MATEGKKLIVYIRKSLVFPVRISYRFALDHPFFLGMVFFLHILYRYCPTIFAFLVSSSPVIFCTTLLLGILLVYGEPNTLETREGKRQGISSRKGAVKGRNISLLRSAVKVSDDGEPMIKMDKSDLESHLDSSVVSSCRPAEGHDNSSGSESDATDNSSPDDSVADFVPLLDELHPLLDSEAPQPAHVSADNSDADSSGNSQDNESDEDSADEEAEIHEDEAREKDDTIEAVVTWTADDQKNLTDLGSSELERNQRLENLIAKRRARKFLSFHAEKNLIDLDSNDPVPNMDDILRFQHQIPSISAPRRNPFDLPFDTGEYAGLPAIPGSAPSVLQPRRNPFDLPLEQVEGSDNLARENMKRQEFAPTAQREMPYRRHESFTLGASFSMDSTQEPHDSKLKPYFVPERMDSEGTSLATLQGQSSEKSDSKSSSTHESDTNSSIVDPKDHSELVEEFHMESHVLPNHYSEPVEQGSQSSEEVDSVNAGHEDVIDHRAIHLNSSTEGNHQSADAVEMVIRQGEFHSSDAQAENLEVIEERYDDSSSSSSGANEKSRRTSFDGNEVNLEQTRNDIKDSSSAPADSDISNITERADDTKSVGPVYDSSPPAVDMSLPNMSTFGESLPYAGKELSSGNSMTSDVQISSSEETGFVSVSRSTDEVFSGTTELWIAPPSLAAVDEIESRSKEVSEVRELDVIPVLGPVIGPVPLEIVYPAQVSTVGSGSSKGREVEADVTTNAARSSVSSESGVPYTLKEMPVIQQAAVKESDLGISNVGIATSSSLTGLQLNAEGADSGDKLEADVSSSSGSTKLGKIRNMAKFW